MQLHFYSVMCPQELLDIHVRKCLNLHPCSEVILKFLETYLPCYVERYLRHV